MSLGDHLRAQGARLDELEALLDRERRALGEGRVDGALLSRLAEDKQRLFDELERAETQRRQAQHRLGYAEGASGAEQAARDADCLAAWQALLESAERTARRNALNGRLIHQRLEHNQRMLNALHEMAGNPVYGRDGQSRRSGGQLSSRA